MVGRAVARFVRVSPRKTGYVLSLIRGRNVEEAFAILSGIQKGPAFYIAQILKSALDSAVKKTNKEADASNLFISKATADGGPMLKRYKAGSMGRAMPIKRRTAHLTVELDMVRQPVRQPQVTRVKKQEGQTNEVKSQKVKGKSIRQKANVH